MLGVPEPECRQRVFKQVRSGHSSGNQEKKLVFWTRERQREKVMKLNNAPSSRSCATLARLDLELDPVYICYVDIHVRQFLVLQA